MNNDNSSNLCTRMQLQQTDGYCSKCQNTKDLQPQKDDNNNTSPTPSTTYDGLYKKDKRLCNSKHSTKTIIENLSDKKTNSIINIVESTFQLTTNNGSTSKFESMIEAKEYFVRKFSYMGIITSKATNMFNFVCPGSCRNITDIVDYPKYEKFHVDRKAITSIYDTNWLDDSAVNLVLACLNYVSINITKQSVVPKYLFGGSFDGAKVRPDEKLFPNIDAYMKCSSDDETEEMIAKCNDDMKLWFSNEQKAKLSPILDAYSAQSKKISNYITCINIWN